MIGSAVEFIKKAEQFKGKPSEGKPSQKNNNIPMVVSFTLIFPSENELKQYEESFKD